MNPPQRLRGDDGTAFLELALIAPLLVMLAFGAIDFAMAYRARNGVTTIARQGARVEANLGNSGGADYFAINAITAALGDLKVANITKVVVFNSTTADGKVPANCLTSTALSNRGVDNVCNVYPAATIAAPNPTSFGGTASADFTARTSCVSANFDRRWCPLNRNVRADLVDGSGNNLLDYVGVYVEYNYQLITGAFGKTIKLAETTVMRLEPKEPV